VLRVAGLKVVTTPGWESRGKTFTRNIAGVIGHHTAGPRLGNMPSLAVITHGRPDLPGPLAQLGLGRDGTFFVVASGIANHAGAGYWKGLRGNSDTIGIEAENCGDNVDVWPSVQMDAYACGVRVILDHCGLAVDHFCAHYEWARPVGRKIDPRGPWQGGGDWYSGGTNVTRTADRFRAYVAAAVEEDDDMAGRLIVMVPGAPPSNVGRWQYWRLNGENILSCNGAPALEGSSPIFGVPSVPLPVGHRPILGIEPAPDGNGVVAIADDQGTFTFRVAV
jgi:hypothetical protein